MFAIVWEFEARSGSEEAIERINGPDGEWTRFFSTDPEFLGTEMLREEGTRRYLTIDRWTSRAAYETFCERRRAEYETIDRSLERLTEKERKIGAFVIL